MKWVLLPYNKQGKPLQITELEEYSCLYEYLFKNKERLQNRKGQMLNALLKRGYWWAMLGVGKYCFSNYKVVWEAYGRKSFNPVIFEGNWQVNQSLQAFIPVETKIEAVQILQFLSDKSIENYLLSMKMQGTMSWAQPGKIKKLFSFI